MDTQDAKRESWESLSSQFSSIDISLSQGSCYSSEGTSITSTIPAGVASSAVPSFMSATASSLPPFLSSILKKPCTVDDEESRSESGYESDTFDRESDISIVDAETLTDEEEDNELYYVPRWDEKSKIIDLRTDTEKPMDESFVGFESAVRFDSNVQYIEPPVLQEEEQATPEPTDMTFHEMMDIARKSGNLRFVDEESIDSHSKSCSSTHNDTVGELEEHTRDIVDLDKRLFVAYMNGMSGIADACRPHLRRRASDSRHGRLCSPFFEPDSASCAYLDQVLHHVIGVFPNLVVKEEFDELVALHEKKSALEHELAPSREAVQQCAATLLGKIEYHLSERLAKGNVNVGADEISFFAAGVADALENGDVLFPHSLLGRDQRKK